VKTLNTNNNEGKKARIQALILIITGFVLIFCILTATILYTVYDRSLIDFIQDFGKEEMKETEPTPEYKNPAIMEYQKATEEHKENLLIITDSVLSNLSANSNLSIKENAYYNNIVSPTNFNEVLFENHQNPDKKVTLQDLLSEKKPEYLLLNFSKAILDLNETACSNFFGAILKMVAEIDAQTTVIISGPLPVFASNTTTKIQIIQRLDKILETISGKLHESGYKVYYLPTPTHQNSNLCNDNGTLLDRYQDADNADILDATDGCWDYFNNHILQYSIPTETEAESAA
jgi:hypothetical protein